jgi:integrase
MSVYKSAKSPFYAYDFQIDGRRFHGSTKARSKRDAEAVERQLKATAKAEIAQEVKAGHGPITLDFAAGRYWTEVGQHHRGSLNTHHYLDLLISFFGPNKRLDQITDDDVAALVAWRRAQPVHGRAKTKDGKVARVVGHATVNRTALLPLKAIFTRAKRTWRYSLPMEPNWRDHWLKEPAQRVRELDEHESAALDGVVREDYALWFQFARATGLRRQETLIKWSNVNWSGMLITTVGKRGATITTPITRTVQSILEQCQGHHDEYVFTFVCRRSRDEQVKGNRYPITTEGAKTMWRRMQSQSGVKDFRFHDIRHDVATKLLRKTGNMRLVQRALNHSNIATTARYAHVLNAEVAAALDELSESRNNPRKTGLDVV